MSEPITLRFGHDPRLLRRSLTGWWQSAVPPQSFIGRSVGWAVIWLAVGFLAMGLLGFGFPVAYVVAGFAGAGLFLAGFVYLQLTRMRRFYAEIGRHWARAGETEARIGPEGLTLADAVSRRELGWGAIDAVRGVRGATVFRSGVSMIAVPDTALPEGMSPRAFRARVDGWRGAA